MLVVLAGCGFEVQPARVWGGLRARRLPVPGLVAIWSELPAPIWTGRIRRGATRLP